MKNYISSFLFFVFSIGLYSCQTKSESKKERLVWIYLDQNNNECSFSKTGEKKWREINSTGNSDVFYFNELEANDEYILLSDDNRGENTTVFIKLYNDKCFYQSNKTNWRLLYTGHWK